MATAPDRGAWGHRTGKSAVLSHCVDRGDQGVNRCNDGRHQRTDAVRKGAAPTFPLVDPGSIDAVALVVWKVFLSISDRR